MIRSDLNKLLLTGGATERCSPYHLENARSNPFLEPKRGNIPHDLRVQGMLSLLPYQAQRSWASVQVEVRYTAP